MSCSCHHHEEHCSCHNHAHGCCGHAESEEHENHVSDLIAIGVSAVFLVLSFVFSKSVLRYVFLAVSYLAVGFPVVLNAIKGIFSGSFFDEETLMSIATVGAIACGEYTEAVGVMLFYRIGELVQDIAVDRSRKQIAAAVELRPDTATVERNGVRSVVDPESVAVGETIIVGVGERIPLDGTVLSGTSRLDCSSLTGESKSVHIAEGDSVYSGTVNLISELKIRTTALCADSASGRLLKAIDEAAESKPKLERFITRFSKIYTPCVVGLAVLVAVIPPLLGLGSFQEWIHRALTFLVISCPCALVLSIPLTFYSGLGMLTKRDVLPKSADSVERLAGIRAVAFDKTGTLTTGQFSVLAVHPVGCTEQELLAHAAVAEQTSPHPIAKAIVAASPFAGKPDTAEEHVGKGVVAHVGESTIAVGNAGLMQELGISVPDSANGVLVAVNGVYAGSIEVGDTVRESAPTAVKELSGLGISSYMLTGDTEKAARAVAERVGISHAMSALLPEGKVEKLSAIRAEEGAVAFVGDGMNDSPVLRGADIGIAMADRGVELAAETADMLLLSGNLAALPEAVRIAKRTVRTAKLNVCLALGIKLLAMVLSALGIAGMWIAVVADSGAALLCVLVALTVFKRD